MHYFIEFGERLPDIKQLKISSPGVSVDILSDTRGLKKHFLNLVTESSLSSNSQSHKRCAEETFDAQELCNERQKKSRVHGTEGLSGYNAYAESQRRLVAGSPKSTGAPLLLRDQRWPQTIPSLNSAFVSSFRDLTLTSSGSNQDTLGPEKLPTSTLATSGEMGSANGVSDSCELSNQMMENCNMSSPFWKDDQYLKKVHSELKHLRKRNEKILAEVRAAKSAQHDAEYALHEERERGKQFQAQLDSVMRQLGQMREDMDAMRKRFSNEDGVRSDLEGCRAQASVSLEQSTMRLSLAAENDQNTGETAAAASD